MPLPAARRIFLFAALTVVGCAEAAKPKPAPEAPGPSLCPAEVTVEQRVANPPQGWDPGLSDLKPQLAMVTFFDGPPAERASLKYDSELKQRGSWVATWTLAPNARGYWIQCAYDNTTVVLSRRLPETARTCAVSYERSIKAANALPLVKHVACK